MHGRNLESAGPKRWIKRALAVVITFHFFAIFTTVVGTGTIRYPAPQMVEAVRFSPPISAYLQSIFLTNPYRFYAPDPGPTHLMWFRLEYGDGAVRWAEVARRNEFVWRIPYQRHMSLTMLLGGIGIMPSPSDNRKVWISPEGQVSLSSYVRHVAIAHPRFAADGAPIPVQWVSAYHVYHNIREPNHIRLGWQDDDFRLYDLTFLGQYQADGARAPLDPLKPGGVYVQAASLFAANLLRDVGAKTQGMSAAQRLSFVAELDLPAAWQKLISQFPDLVTELPVEQPDEDWHNRTDDVRDRIVRHVQELTKSPVSTDADSPSP